MCLGLGSVLGHPALRRKSAFGNSAQQNRLKTRLSGFVKSSLLGTLLRINLVLKGEDRVA